MQYARLRNQPYALLTRGVPGCRKTRVSAQKIAAAKESIDDGLKSWDPAKDPLAEVRAGVLTGCRLMLYVYLSY